MSRKIDPEIKKRRIKEYAHKYWERNKEKCKAYGAAYRKSEAGKKAREREWEKRNHDPRIIAMRRAYYSRPEWKAKAKAMHLSLAGKLSTYKHSAKRRNLAFEFTLDDFKNFEGKPCSYCGCEMPYIGLDRVDNTLGYTKENTTPCCYDCNKGKMTMGALEYINHCQKVVEYSKRGPIMDMLAKYNDKFGAPVKCDVN